MIELTAERERESEETLKWKMKKELDDLHVSRVMNEFDENFIYVSHLMVQNVIIKQNKNVRNEWNCSFFFPLAAAIIIPPLNVMNCFALFICVAGPGGFSLSLSCFHL